MGGSRRKQRSLGYRERDLKIFSRALIIAFVLLAAFVQMSAADYPDLTIDKTATPVSGECNQHQITLSVTGYKADKPVDVFLVLDVSGCFRRLNFDPPI
jgi:hypothetical protein